jgi:outer membrane protein
MKTPAAWRWLRAHRHLLLALALMVLGLLLMQSDARAASLDLLDVFQQARAADPVLAAARAQRGVQQEAAVLARAALLPQWRLSVGGSRGEGGATRRHEIVSSLDQVLLDLGRLRTLDAERSLESAQDAQLRAAEQALAARVAQAYFGVLSTQAALATAQVNEAAFATQAAQSQSRFEAGLAAQVDVEQSRTYHALSRGGTVLARQALADARAALAQITGRDAGTLRPLADPLSALPPQPAQAQDWVDQALQAHPALQALTWAVQAGEHRIDAARAGHAPSVVASLDTVRAGGPGAAAADNGRHQTQLAVRLSLPLFAGGATQSAVRRAAFQRDVLREELLSARRAVARETQTQHQAVLAGVALLDSTADAVAAAERALAATRSGQALGTRSNTDLLLAIQTQAAARNAHDQARHGVVLARLLLQQAVGSLGVAELAAANALLERPQGDR